MYTVHPFWKRLVAIVIVLLAILFFVLAPSQVGKPVNPAPGIRQEIFFKAVPTLTPFVTKEVTSGKLQ